MDIKNSPVKKQKFPMIDHGIDIIGDEWEDEDDWASNEINTDALRAEEDWEKKEYEKRNDPEHPYCTNWPVNKKKEKENENV